jgi:hypothetical protein
MAVYRFYVFTADRRAIKAFGTALCDSDDEAIRIAIEWAKGEEVEVGESDRIVAFIEGTQKK